MQREKDRFLLAVHDENNYSYCRILLLRGRLFALLVRSDRLVLVGHFEEYLPARYLSHFEN